VTGRIRATSLRGTEIMKGGDNSVLKEIAHEKVSFSIAVVPTGVVARLGASDRRDDLSQQVVTIQGKALRKDRFVRYVSPFSVCRALLHFR